MNQNICNSAILSTWKLHGARVGGKYDLSDGEQALCTYLEGYVLRQLLAIGQLKDEGLRVSLCISTWECA